MALNLQQQLGQQQILSPQMRQGLEILQTSSMELSQVIQQAMEVNPVLDRLSDDQPLERDTQVDAERDGEVIAELADHQREEQIYQGKAAVGPSQETVDFFYESIVAPQTLQQHLLSQLQLAAKPEKLHQAAEIIIWSLNDRGFLTESLEQIAIKEGTSQQTLISASGVVQQFDPAGVGACDIVESLLIQLARKKLHNSVETRIVREHLADVANKRYPEIAKSLGVTVDAITKAVETIAGLTLNPGAAFDPTQNPHIRPDVIVSYNEEGELQAHLTGAHIPQLSISNDYKDILSSTADTETRKYLKDQIRDGRSLISSISQRQETLLKITEVLLDKQKDFFSKGKKALKPLTMNEVAELIEVHPTTVSRAANSKYILTPQGLHELRFFFTSGVTAEDGSTLSNTSIQDSIKDLIDNENPKKPYSDSALEKMLKQQDIKVARRTIAKYRDQLGILPSNLRKQF